jgi:hypothetical protein
VVQNLRERSHELLLTFRLSFKNADVYHEATEDSTGGIASNAAATNDGTLARIDYSFSLLSNAEPTATIIGGPSCHPCQINGGTSAEPRDTVDGGRAPWKGWDGKAFRLVD